MEKMSGASILMKFFGRKPNQTLQEFSEELKQLSEDEKKELITLAAVELGVEVK